MQEQPLSNRPAIPSPDIIREFLADENADLLRRRDDLLAAFERAPSEVNDDEAAGKLGDFIKQIAAAITLAERRRVDSKEPAMAAAKAIDGFYSPVKDALTKAKTALTERVGVYLRKKEAEERRRLEETAASARAEAKRLEDEAAAKIKTAPKLVVDAAIETAAGAAQASRDAGDAATAKPADLARTRGDYGAVATLRQVWDFEIESLDAARAAEALRPYFSQAVVETAIRAYVKAGGRELPGVKIFQKAVAAVS